MNYIIGDQKLETEIIAKEIFSAFDIYFNRLGFKYNSILTFNSNLYKHSLEALAFKAFGNKSSLGSNSDYLKLEDSKSITTYIICDIQKISETLQNKKALITKYKSKIKLTHSNTPTPMNNYKYITNKIL